MNLKLSTNTIVTLLFFILLFHFSAQIITSYYNVPTTVDDVCFSLGYHNNNVFSSIKDYLLYSSGRFFSVPLLHLLNSFGKESLISYKTLPVVFILSICISVFFLVKKTLNLPTKNSIIFTFVFCILFLNKLPSLAEGFYWISSLIVYPMSFILFIISLGQIYNSVYLKRKNYYFSTIILLLTLGSSEATFLVLGSLIFLITFYKNIIKKNKNTLLYVYSAIVILGVIYMKFNPANMNRQLTIDLNLDNNLFSKVFETAFTQMYNFVDLSMIGFTVFFIIFFNKSIIKAKWLNFPFYYLFLFSANSLLLPQFLSLIGTNGIPPRIENVIFFFLILNFFVWLSYIVFHFRIKFNRKGIVLVLVLLFSGLFSINGNSRKVYSDLKNGVFKGYKQEFDKRHDLLRSNKSKIEIVPFNNKPYSIFFNDMDHNSNKIWSGCLENYYNKEEVIFLPRN